MGINFRKNDIHLAVDENTSGDQTLIAAVANKKIRILNICLITADDLSIKFKSGSTDLTGVMKLATAGNGFVADQSVNGSSVFETAEGEAFVLNLSASIQIGGWIVYQLVAPADT